MHNNADRPFTVIGEGAVVAAGTVVARPGGRARLEPVRQISSHTGGPHVFVLVSGVWRVEMQGGGGRQRGALATDDNAA
ncbi:hypothetical protein ABZ369_39290, partial [Streptomyces sp. NPDC005918]|uniref:hypothetical protein n=1 Tax=Streptomyces sp. NPDC005918 TaxID=3155454 RepID=UPI0033DCE8CD